MGRFEQGVAGIGALAEPVRRELYLFVCAQQQPVSRDQAAAAVGIARHVAKFHLDKLEDEGVLESDYARISGRSGPGAGRPSKVYRRSAREIAVSLPDREYELAGMLMAAAIAESTRTGEPILETLHRAATARGAEIGSAFVGTAGIDRAGSDPAPGAMELAILALTTNGYQPRRDGDRVIMTNCPFHALAKAHTQLVCTMNHALLSGLVESVAPQQLCARLEPGENRCCVVLSQLLQS
ncbi:MAG: helix-turn-helix transcriptional regulator [Nakamurella sp.]